MGKLSRDKGQRAELDVCHLLTDMTGHKVTRKVRQHEDDSDLVGLPGWCIEVKNANVLQLGPWWDQAHAQAEGDDRPLLVYRKTHIRRWRVRCLLADVAHPKFRAGAVMADSLLVDMDLEDWVKAVGLYRYTVRIGGRP